MDWTDLCLKRLREPPVCAYHTTLLVRKGAGLLISLAATAEFCPFSLTEKRLEDIHVEITQLVQFVAIIWRIT
jgi:hypothetical protein